MNMLTDIFALGKFDYGVMVRYQNLTRKPELFRVPRIRCTLLNPALADPANKCDMETCSGGVLGLEGQVLENCPVLGSRTTLLFGLLKFFRSAENFFPDRFFRR